jgi:protein-S-isoprenylcysteine O-methyltransferase Ste14
MSVDAADMDARPITRVPPPAVFALGLVLGFACQFFVYRLELPWHARTWRLLGAPFVLAGIASVISAMRQFEATEQDPRPWIAQDKTPRLIVNGPCRFSRNPMYLGELLSQIGLGLFFNNLWIPLFAFAALLIVQQVVVLREETHLCTTVGAPYERYLRTVRRWI